MRKFFILTAVLLSMSGATAAKMAVYVSVAFDDAKLKSELTEGIEARLITPST
jgi:hypothetical protein